MGELARFILFYTGEDDGNGDKHSSSNVVGIGEAGYMIISSSGALADVALADDAVLSE